MSCPTNRTGSAQLVPVKVLDSWVLDFWVWEPAAGLPNVLK